IIAGSPLVTIHSRHQLSVDSSGEEEGRGNTGDEMVGLLEQAIRLSDAPVEPGPLILDIIR
ncbi:MAG TPA: hypothetical protein VGW38_06940, partial [Chloroflexota bacterium]|nr:hypothetical protein [Chloroflexota bacterium]